MTEKEIVQALRCMATRDERRDCEIAKRSQLGCAECISSYIRDAADAIERLTAENAALREKVPQWVSVEDRLPEAWKNEEDDTLINYMIYSPYFGVDIGNYHKEAGTWLCMALPCTVTHWMPLPGAPEGGKHE